MIVKIITDPDKKENICRSILADLPEWFGIPEATESYCLGVRDKTFLVASENDQIFGFISIVEHNEYTSEIYVIGVYKRYRNNGVGSLLLKSIINMIILQNKQFLTVKTLDESRASIEYEETRKFYLAKGFIPLEVFPELWGAENPCLFLVKPL